MKKYYLVCASILSLACPVAGLAETPDESIIAEHLASIAPEFLSITDLETKIFSGDLGTGRVNFSVEFSIDSAVLIAADFQNGLDEIVAFAASEGLNQEEIAHFVLPAVENIEFYEKFDDSGTTLRLNGDLTYSETVRGYTFSGDSTVSDELRRKTSRYVQESRVGENAYIIDSGKYPRPILTVLDRHARWLQAVEVAVEHILPMAHGESFTAYKFKRREPYWRVQCSSEEEPFFLTDGPESDSFSVFLQCEFSSIAEFARRAFAGEPSTKGFIILRSRIEDVENVYLYYRWYNEAQQEFTGRPHFRLAHPNWEALTDPISDDGQVQFGPKISLVLIKD